MIRDDILHTDVSAPSPFLKWAGGKRWLMRKYACLFPTSYNRYYEPFLGSGAVFFSLAPRRGVLSDRNSDLISTYQAIKSDWRRVASALKELARAHSTENYYYVRDSFAGDNYQRAARFVYLNRTCWNGLYRVNAKGHFNVPKGSKDSVVLATDCWSQIAEALKGMEIKCADFSEVIGRAKSGDLIFLDPPYTIKTKETFVRYNTMGFSWEQQVRLCDEARRAASRGALVMVTHKANNLIRGMYEDAGFNVKYVSRMSVIAADPSGRGRYGEMLMRSWK